jgi:sugar/nucleoside kinase (ribokinase family)
MKKVTCAGILVADLIAADLPRVSPPGDITFAPRGIGVHIGGHAANVSADLIGLGMKAGEVSCLGAVGEDLFGSFFEQALAGRGVSTRLQRTLEALTSVDLILVVKEEDRRYHCHMGANSFFDPDFVLRSVRREPPLLFYAGGAGLMARFDRHLAYVLKEVKKLGCMTFVDPVRPHDGSWDFLREALEWTDIFHCNDLEAQTLTEEARLRKSIRVLLGSGPNIVLVSRGKDGVTAARRGRLLTLGGFKVKTLDPTGAGDAFCAGFIRQTVDKFGKSAAGDLDWEDEDLAVALLLAEAAGAACVTGIGTTSAVTGQNVRRLIAAQGARVRKSLQIEPL